MGGVGDAYDNAMAESFFATLECELLDRRSFKTKTKTKTEARTTQVHSAARNNSLPSVEEFFGVACVRRDVRASAMLCNQK
jgi:hypothetical protein